MTKGELRKKYKDLRSELTSEDVDRLSLDIANNLLKLDIWDEQFYHLFLPIEEQKEVNTEFLLNVLSGKDKNIVISKSNFETLEMRHYLLTDNARIRKNNYNIPEPVDGIEIESKKIDVVFVPLLAYDKKGNRVGYGKGFYDRFICGCRKDILKIGLSFFAAEELIKETHVKDIPLDIVVTPYNVYYF